MKTLARTKNEKAIEILQSAGFQKIGADVLVRETTENTGRWFIPVSRQLDAEGIDNSDGVYAPREFDGTDVENIICIDDFNQDGRDQIFAEIMAAYQVSQVAAPIEVVAAQEKVEQVEIVAAPVVVAAPKHIEFEQKPNGFRSNYPALFSAAPFTRSTRSGYVKDCKALNPQREFVGRGNSQRINWAIDVPAGFEYYVVLIVAESDNFEVIYSPEN